MDEIISLLKNHTSEEEICDILDYLLDINPNIVFSYLNDNIQEFIDNLDKSEYINIVKQGLKKLL